MEDEVVARLRAAGCVFAEEEAALLREAVPPGPARQALVDRRVAGAPLEQVLGWVAFAGLRVPVRPGVFVPRRRTELLAEQAVAACPPAGVVVELCCGAAAVSLVVLAAHPGAELHAADLDPVAVECARANLAGRARVHTGDLYAALPSRLAGRVDVLVANAPYVPTASIALMPAEAREHEPTTALDGGGDGLAVLSRVVAGAPTWPAPGGWLLVECSERQTGPLGDLAVASGLRPEIRRDVDREAVALLATPV
ncbi:putative protein N(5)-glutamine methyltransferase [Microlunatus lacustris]